MNKVFTDGVFDLFHSNHWEMLNDASELGDFLLVGVVSDKTAMSYKRRPIMSEKERLRAVQQHPLVNECFIIDGLLISSTMKDIMKVHDISTVVYAGTSTPDFYLPAEEADIMRRIPYREGITSSVLIDRVIERFKSGDI